MAFEPKENTKSRTRWSAGLIACAIGLGTLSQAQGAGDPAELLREADRARGGLLKGVSWNIDLISKEDGTESKRSFRVKAKGDDALAEATAPARTKGEVFLFNDRTMWFYKTGLRKPVAISARQKLSGQAANGDIASTHYSRDYEVVSHKEEKLGDEPTMVLELKARNKNVTYDKIRYWISTGRKLGVRAQFLSLQGQVLKEATFEYGNQLKAAGKSYPFVSQMRIQDAKIADNQSTIIYEDPKEQEHPMGMFNVNQLIR